MAHCTTPPREAHRARVPDAPGRTEGREEISGGTKVQLAVRLIFKSVSLRNQNPIAVLSIMKTRLTTVPQALPRLAAPIPPRT